VNIDIHARAVMLDMDGTLVDSTAVVERIWGDWATSHSLDPSSVLQVIHGRQVHDSMAILLPDRPHEENLAESRSMLERETTELAGIVAIPGSAALLTSLAAHPHALVTSATASLAQARMTAAGLGMPKVAVTAEDVVASKPDPEGFVTAARLLDVPADACVAFEDSAAGITAAQGAGMRVIGVGPAAANRGADWTVHDLSDVAVSGDEGGINITLTRRG
jgi:mannitol-1-/sugar-/sorbitol-6-phosphatase